MDGEHTRWRALLARLDAKPDLTLHALLAELRERGVVLSATHCGGSLNVRASASKNRVRDRAGSS